MIPVSAQSTAIARKQPKCWNATGLLLISSASKDLMSEQTESVALTPLSADDLISNEPLAPRDNTGISEDDDSFQHRHVAERVAQLIASPGSNVNIAVNGPWGSGKSSFFALLKEELQSHTNTDGEQLYQPVDFDAWQMADDTFEANFLATVADSVDKAPKNIEQRLFRANRTVSLPFGVDVLGSTKAKAFFWIGLGLVFALALWVTLFQTFEDRAVVDGFAAHDWAPLVPTFIAKLFGVLGATAGGTVLVVLITALLDLKKVTVQESGPAHVTEFRRLFRDIVVHSDKTLVILIDELDRCAPEAVMRTLEGLRRFLGHERCVFVVAFDRESVVETVDSELTRRVPVRHGRPYYSTAGEYLDKIFTYQVALPPQPRKAFRAYARDLINAKGDKGVWGELRDHDPAALSRTISILSPPHLTSPRRTKVILNDFAINARLTQSFIGRWVDRSDEIAVLTVLQTEFPLFYADLEHYPNLLSHVAHPGRATVSEALTPLVERYTSDHARLDTVLSKTPDDKSSGAAPSVSAPLDPGKALAQQLRRFLQKLNDMRIEFPRADLIQLGANQRILSFDDPSVYAVVEAATEVPRDETLATLAGASSLDRYRAVDLILQSIEGEASLEAMTLRILAGTLLPGLDDDHRTVLAPNVTSAWHRIIEEKGITLLTRDAFTGYAGLILPRSNARAVSDILEETHADVTLHVPALDAVTQFTHPNVLHRVRVDVVESACDMLPDAAPLLRVLRRLDETNVPTLGRRTALRVAEQLTTDPDSDDDKTVIDTAKAVQLLVDLADELPAQSVVLSWIFTVLRTRALEDVEAAPPYLAALDGALAVPGKRNVVADEILGVLSMPSAVALRPSLASRIPGNTKPDPATLRDALSTLLEMVAEDSADSDTRESARQGLSEFPMLGTSDTTYEPEDVRTSIGEAYTEQTDYTRDRYDLLRDVAHSLAGLPSLTPIAHEFAASLAANGVRGVVDTADRTHVLQGLHSEPVAVLRLVQDDLEERLPGVNGRRKWMVGALVAVHHALLRAGQTVDPLPLDSLQPYISQSGDSAALYGWIGTAPRAADVIEMLDGAKLSSVPDDTWELYASRADLDSRTTLWRAAVDTTTPAATLRAIASTGIEDAALAEAGQELIRATNTRGRMRALEHFDTLPRTRNTTAAIEPALEQWVIGARVSEARIVFELILRHHGSLSRPAVSRLNQLVPLWFEKTRGNLSRQAGEQLRALGYLRTPPKKRRNGRGRN